jgi:hypothetical protein
VKRLVALIVLLVSMAGCAGNGVHIVPSKELPNDVYSGAGGAPTVKDRRVTLFMFDGNRLTPVLRKGPSKLPNADLAFLSLLCGPTAEEKAGGLTTALEGVETVTAGVSVGSDRVASVDLGDEASIDTPDLLLRRAAQIVYTLTELETIDSVAFFLNTRRISVPDQDNVAHSEPVARARYARFGPRTTLEKPEFEGALPLDSKGECRTGTA